jgi:hypothetical protein
MASEAWPVCWRMRQDEIPAWAALVANPARGATIGALHCAFDQSDVLDTFEQSQRLHIANRDYILRALAALNEGSLCLPKVLGSGAAGKGSGRPSRSTARK